MSLAAHDAEGPLKVLRWSATRWRHMERIRDRLMFGCGTDELWFFDAEFYGNAKAHAVAAHWRKPLRIDEVNLMAPTREAVARPGRP